MEKLEIKDGFILYQSDERNPEYIELRQIFVNEDSRHKGLGTELLKELKKLNKVIVTYSSTDPEREVFGKWLVAEGFVKTNEQNSCGDMWKLEVKALEVPVKIVTKNAKKTKGKK